ncbi:MAG: phage tail sheath subtilisin-like domain-containing protein [Verrucomicrobiota bacterium]
MSDAALRTPGLYLRVLETQAPSPARTALTAFVGVSERGPLDNPQIVGSFGDFVTVFGDVWSHGALGDSVYAFFLNGGEEAAVVRVARQGALGAPVVVGCAAKQDLATATATAPFVDGNGAHTLSLAARNPGSWGNAIQAVTFADSARLMDLGRLTVSAAGAATDIIVDSVYDFRVGGGIRVVHAENPFIKKDYKVNAIDETLRRLTLDAPVPPAGFPAGSTVAGPGFRLAVNDGARREVFDGLSMNPRHPRFFVDAVNGPASMPYLDLARQGHSVLVTAAQQFGPGGQSRFKPAPSAAAVSFAGGADGLTFALGTLNDGAAVPSVVATARIGGRAGAAVTLVATPFASPLALAVPPEPLAPKDRLILNDIGGWMPGDTVTVTQPPVSETATIVSVDADKHEVRLAAALANDFPLGATAAVAGRFTLRVGGRTGIDAPELFPNLSMTAGPRLFSAVVNGPGGSHLVCLSAGAAAAGPPVGTVALAGGTDPDEVPLPAFTGYTADGALFLPPGAGGAVGMAALEAITAVNLVTAPDLVKRADLAGDPTTLALGQTQVLFHCQKMGERFAILDMPPGMAADKALEWPAHFTDPRLARYGALYHPWLRMAVAGADRPVPPSGVMAGLFARVDREGGVGRAPANVQLKGAIGLEQDIDALTQGGLNDAGVNCVRKFEVGAVRLWGARTLSRDDQYLYVHNRRVVLLVIKGLSVGLRWAVFEPNDFALRKRVKAAIEGFLRGVLARGLASGGRVEDAFFVNVGAGDDLNDAGTRDAGQLVAEVGIAVAKPAEFIVITVKRTPDILTLVEEET